MSALTQNLRHTLRKLLRAPLFSGVAILTLAVAIGSNAAIFSVVNGVLLRPLPFEDPETLVGIWHTAPGLGFPEVNQAPALHFTYLDESRTFETVGMWDNGSVSVTQVAEPEQVPSMRVTHQILPMLGIRPAMGRTFTEEDDSPGTPETVILGYGYWQRRFGGDPSAVGRTLTVTGRPMEIIGVLPAGVRFLAYDPDVYLPFRFDRAKVAVSDFSYQAMGRLRPDATLAQANADVERMVPMATERFPGGITKGMLEQAQFGALVRPLKQDVVGDVGKVLWVLVGTVAMVLLIACANVANLFLVRAEGQQQEMAVRTAMGASRAQITGQLLWESVVLGTLAGTLGLALAYGGIELLVALGPESLPRLNEIAVDGRAMAFTLLVSVGSGALFGLFPAVRFGATSLASTLKEGGRGGSAGKAQHVVRNALVVAQIALALVLLAGSGLMVRSFQALRNVDPGFTDPDEVLTFRVSIPAAEIEDPLVMARTHQEILRRVQAIPGVASAAITTSVTMDGTNNDALESETNPVEGDQLPPIRRYKFIGEGTFATLGNRMVAGRDLTWADIDQVAKVVVVTEDLARAEWGDARSAIGKRVRQSGGADSPGDWYEVVGVSGEIRDDGVGRDPVPTVYWPQVVVDFWGNEGPFAQRSLAYAVRVRAGDPNSILPAVREAVWAVNPNLPLARVRTLDEIAAGSMAQTSFTLIMLGIAAAVALFLGAVGIYGVISYVVSQRTREIGVRMAMGAESADVSRMVLKQAGALAALGVGVGLVAAAGLTRLMASLLFGVSVLDPVTFASVAVSLAVVALVASWVPAYRASRVDPVVALRME
ncbi:MAG TPA: ABC transporter permease [Longimicrobiales bacterium]|nr:ABC transporter permease [Longimicrobiales bacterium]